MENKELEVLKEKYADFIAGLSDEDKAKVDACKTVGELTALAQNAEGELPDDVVEAVAGGGSKTPSGPQHICPKCKSRDCHSTRTTGNLQCSNCGYESVYTEFTPGFI
ncbi:MAG: hypothetical protein IK093_05605 [Ruminiclostridium sp.]|nr:hypothetical protein [Ruminiclostridium sp.]